MHVHSRREATLGRSRRRARAVAWDEPTGVGVGERPADPSLTLGWDDVDAAARFAGAAVFGCAPALTRRSAVGPALVLLSGLPGSGKSHLARLLAERLDVTVVSSDRVRRLLIARPTYSAAEHALIHTVCARLVERGLRDGRAMVLDATNLRVLGRRRYRDLAQAHGAPYCAVLLTCPEETARARLRRRVASPVSDASEADERIYDLMRAGQEAAGDFDLHLRGDGDARSNVAAVAMRLLPGAAGRVELLSAAGAR